MQVAGSEKRQATLTSMFSVVDYFTIPAVLISAVLDRYFTGRVHDWHTFYTCTVEVNEKLEQSIAVDKTDGSVL